LGNKRYLPCPPPPTKLGEGWGGGEKDTRLKWNFKKKDKKQANKGLVGVQLVSGEKSGIAMAYVAEPNAPRKKIDAYAFEEGKTAADYQKALTQFVNTHNLQGVLCSYVLAPTDYTLTLMDSPHVEQKEMAQAMRWLVQEVINFPIDEAIIDTIELPLPRARDNNKMLYTVVMRRTLIPNIEQLINPSGLILTYIDIPEMALNNISKLSVESAESVEKQKGTIFVYLNSEGGNLILCREGLLYITRALTQPLKTLESPEKNVESERHLENLVVEIQRLLDYFINLFRQVLFDRVIIAPTTLNPELIRDGFQKRLGMDIQSLDLKKFMDIDSKQSPPMAAKCLLALGAALRTEESHETTS